MADVISQREGRLIRQERWGKHRMAYSIKRWSEAFYVFFHYEGKPDIPLELERRFKQTDSVLRYLTLQKEARDATRRKRKKSARRSRKRRRPKRPPSRGRPPRNRTRGEVRWPEKREWRSRRTGSSFRRRGNSAASARGISGYRLQERGHPEKIHPERARSRPAVTGHAPTTSASWRPRSSGRA